MQEASHTITIDLLDSYIGSLPDLLAYEVDKLRNRLPGADVVQITVMKFTGE